METWKPNLFSKEFFQPEEPFPFSGRHGIWIFSLCRSWITSCKINNDFGILLISETLAKFGFPPDPVSIPMTVDCGNLYAKDRGKLIPRKSIRGH